MSSDKVLKVAYAEDLNEVLAARSSMRLMWWVEWRGMADSEQWTMLYGPGVGFVDDDGNYRFGLFFFDSRFVWSQSQIPIYAFIRQSVMRVANVSHVTSKRISIVVVDRRIL